MGKELTLEQDSLDRVEPLAKQFDKANTVFNEAMKTVERRKELLEEALREYVEILALIPNTDSRSSQLIKRTVLTKVHAVEAMIEQEIEKSVISSINNSSNNNSSSNDEIEEALAKARTRLLAID